MSRINKWFQEGQPSSYKIQIKYVDIPQHMVLDKKTVDTPFRFRNFEEASKTAGELFKGYETVIVGSNDRPHWQNPETRMVTDELRQQSWYDVYGVTPAYSVDINRQRQQQVQRSERQVQFKELSKIKPAVKP